MERLAIDFRILEVYKQGIIFTNPPTCTFNLQCASPNMRL